MKILRFDEFNSSCVIGVFGIFVITILILVALVYEPAACLAQQAGSPPIVGVAKDDLRPSVGFIQGYSWSVNIFFTSTRSVKDEWWSCIDNKLGSRLRVWTTNGSKIPAKDPDVESAMHQPRQMIMSDLYSRVTQLNHPPLTFFHLDIFPDGLTDAYMFKLGDVFPLDSNRQYVVEISPMLYRAKVDASKLKDFNEILRNQFISSLVEFPPIIARLETNGTVTALKSLPWAKKP